MKTQSIDTSPEAERVLIDRIRTASVAKRFRFVQSWSAAIIEAGRLDVQGLHPSATNEEVRLLYAQRQYRQEIAQQLQVAWHKQPEHHSSFPDLLQTLTPFMLACEHQHITYALSGSLASSLYGMQRATMLVFLLSACSQRGDT